MAKQATKTRKQDTAQNGRDVSSYEQELSDYLQERIKPGLNSGAIPLLARSIAKELAHREPLETADEGEEADTEAEAEVEADGDGDFEEAEAEGDEDFDEAEAEEDFEEEDSDEPEAEADEDFEDEDSDEPEAEADEDFEEEDSDEEDDDASNGEGSSDFEAAMREVQAELGEDWILRFSVQGDDTWLTAEKDDGSQRVEAPTASVLAEVVELLNENGGRSG